jgi:hypothetical protein
MAKRKKKRGQRGRFYKRMTPEEEVEQREAAFAAIRLLYCESLPLWRSCSRGSCRRHRRCCNDEKRKCLQRCWPLMPADVQDRAVDEVIAGGPRRKPPATHMEQRLRCFPPTNFVL